MEENNNIDDIFKSALNNLEMEPSANSWDNLSSKLAAKRAVRARRRAGLWFSAAALLLILSYTSYRLLNNSAPKVQDNKEVETSIPEHNASSDPASVQSESGSNANADHTSSSNVPPVVSSQRGSNAPSASPAGPTASTSTVIQPGSVTTPASSLPRNSTPKNQDNRVSNPAVIAPIAVTPKASQPVASTPEHSHPSGSTTSNSPKAESPSTQNVNAQTTGQPNTSATANGQPSASQQSPAQSSTQANQTATGNTPVTEDIKDNVTSPDAKERKSIAPAVVAGGTMAAGNTSTSGNNSGNNSNPASQDNNSSQENTGSQSDPNAQTDKTETGAKTSGETSPNEPLTNVTPPPAVNDSTQLKNGQNPNSSGSLVKRIASHLGLEVYYTPELAKTKMKVNDDYQGLASKNLSDYQNESTQYSYSAGINLSYKIGNHWSVVGGYSISDFSKSAVYNTIAVVADSVYQDEYVENPGGHQGGSGHHHNSHHGGGGGNNQGGPGGPGSGGWHGHENPTHPGDPGSNHHFIVHTPCGSIDLNNVPPTAATVNNGDTLNVKTETFQSIHFYSFPLLVRYSFGTKKISYFVEGGGAINYVTTDQVKVVINDATTEDNSLDAISNMNYTLLFGVGAKYNFYKGFNFYLKPSLRYSITPINVDSPVKSYPYYLGIGGGISFDF
jgi:hypothetical protein